MNEHTPYIIAQIVSALATILALSNVLAPIAAFMAASAAFLWYCACLWDWTAKWRHDRRKLRLIHLRHVIASLEMRVKEDDAEQHETEK